MRRERTNTRRRQAAKRRRPMMVVPEKYWYRYRSCPHCGFVNIVGSKEGFDGRFECVNCAWTVRLNCLRAKRGLRPELWHVGRATAPRCRICGRAVVSATDPSYRKTHRECFRKMLDRYKAGKGPLPDPPE
jgi:transcription elongation factor Elf1